MNRTDRIRLRFAAAALMLRARWMQHQTGLPFQLCLETQLALRQIRATIEIGYHAQTSYQHHLEQAEAEIAETIAARAADRN